MLFVVLVSGWLLTSLDQCSVVVEAVKQKLISASGQYYTLYVHYNVNTYQMFKYTVIATQQVYVLISLLSGPRARNSMKLRLS